MLGVAAGNSVSAIIEPTVRIHNMRFKSHLFLSQLRELARPRPQPEENVLRSLLRHNRGEHGACVSYDSDSLTSLRGSASVARNPSLWRLSDEEAEERQRPYKPASRFSSRRIKMSISLTVCMSPFFSATSRPSTNTRRASAFSPSS